MLVKLDNLMNTFKRITSRKSVKYAVPFFTLIIGCSVGLREFTNLRYQYSNKKTLTPEEAEKYGIEMKKPGEVTLETEYDKIKSLDIDNWENKRIPRPWEEIS